MKWKQFQHNGILFPPPYKQQNIKFKIKGQDIRLTRLQEEMVYQWAKKKDTPYVQDVVFQNNFVQDFARTFRPIITMTYQDLDFTAAYDLIEREKEAKQLMTKEEKKALAASRKALRERRKKKYGNAIIDGQTVELGNYMVEPPGIFIGRGEHPLRGRWKPKITKKDVTLNLSQDAKVPTGKWKSVVHENDGIWVAKWTDKLTDKIKYVWLADNSYLKQEMDKAKYEKANVLAQNIDTVRETIFQDMNDPEKFTIPTVCYLIYRTSMRVGDEKDSEEADTVGATTLRKEHVRISGDAIKLDFLGKDSVRWKETIKITEEEKVFQRNMDVLVKATKKGREIFNKIKSSDVNQYLSGIVPGITAKVFRTYLATQIVTKYLTEHADIKDKSISEKLYHAKMANLEAAILCNHKRTVPKTFEQSLQKKKERLKKVRIETPWKRTEGMLEKIKNIVPRTPLQKKRRLARMRKTRERIRGIRARYKIRVEKLNLQVRLTSHTRDYNLGTSLRNYIDPRVYKAWTDHVGLEWEKIYTAVLQRKFQWVKNETATWDDIVKGLS